MCFSRRSWIDEWAHEESRRARETARPAVREPAEPPTPVAVRDEEPVAQPDRERVPAGVGD